MKKYRLSGTQRDNEAPDERDGEQYGGNDYDTPYNPEDRGRDEERAMAAKNAVQLSNIEEGGGIITKNGDVSIHTIIIAGQVEGHQMLSPQTKTTRYEQILPQLVAIEDRSDVDGLLLLLNTVGGDVEAGLAIAETVAGMSKPTVSLVLGGGHSIGIPLAVCADKSFIVPTATMTLHPVRMNGLVIGVPQSFAYFTKMQDRIINFIVSHSRAKKELLWELMMETDEIATDVGSIIDGNKAVKIGLIDSVGSLSDAMNCIKSLVREKKQGENLYSCTKKRQCEKRRQKGIDK